MIFLHNRSGQLRTPNRNMHIVSNNQTDIPIKSGTGIPAGRLVLILQTYGQHIGFSLFQVIRGIYHKGIISVRPICGFLSVDEHTGMAHGSVEQQHTLLSCGIFRNLQIQTIPAGAHKRQTSGSSGMLHSLFLSILLNGCILLVIIDTERTVNSPIVWDCYFLPSFVIKIYCRINSTVSFGKSPTLFE